MVLYENCCLGREYRNGLYICHHGTLASLSHTGIKQNLDG